MRRAQQNHTVWDAVVDATAGEIAIGRVLVLNAAGTRYLPSTAANRADVERRSAGIALTEADGVSVEIVEFQFVGIIPPDISQLGEGAGDCDVRVSDDGWLERAETPSEDDELVGTCDADGTAYVAFTGLRGPPGETLPGGNNGEVQYNNAGAFSGAANVEIADGDLCVGTNLGTVATWGQIRTNGGGPGGAGWYITMRNGADDDDLVGFLMYTIDGTGTLMDGDNIVSVGHDQDDGTYSFDQAVFGATKMVGFLIPGVGHDTRFMGRMYADNKCIVHVGQGSNWGMVGGGLDGLAHGDTVDTSPWLGGGQGVGYIGECTTAPTTNPTNGVIFYVDLADNHVKWRKEDGTIVTPLNSLTNVGGGYELVKTKSGINNDIRTLTAGSNVTITQNANTLEIAASGGGGEANTSSSPNSGTPGALEWTMAKSGVDLPFKTLTPEAPFTVYSIADDIRFTLGDLASWGSDGQSIRKQTGSNAFEWYTPITDQVCGRGVYSASGISTIDLTSDNNPILKFTGTPSSTCVVTFTAPSDPGSRFRRFKIVDPGVDFEFTIGSGASGYAGASVGGIYDGWLVITPDGVEVYNSP